MSVDELTASKALTNPLPMLSFAWSVATFILASLPANVSAPAAAAPEVRIPISLMILAKSPEANVVLLMPSFNAPNDFVFPR